MIQTFRNAALFLPFLLLAASLPCSANDAALLHGQVKVQNKPQITTSALDEKWSSDDVVALDEDASSVVPSFLTQTFPRLEVRTSKNYVKVVAELPGVSKGNLDLVANSDILCIQGKRQASGGEKIIMSELPSGSFKRRVRLPYPVKVEQSLASLEDGILTVTLPRWLSAESPKKISVSTSEKRNQ